MKRLMQKLSLIAVVLLSATMWMSYSGIAQGFEAEFVDSIRIIY